MDKPDRKRRCSFALSLTLCGSPRHKHTHSKRRRRSSAGAATGHTTIRTPLTQETEGMTATAKAKTKFSSRNLNAVYKAPLAKAADNGGGYHSSSRMLVLKSSSSVGRSSVLTARGLTAAAPAPINTPSLRMENNGQDVHVHLVPTGKVGWGTNPKSNNDSSSADERELRVDRSHAQFSPSSQAHRGELNGRQVWGSDSTSSSAHSHDEQSIQRRAGTAVSSVRSFGSRSGAFFGGASTGRWGDDAVEQDIARSDMLRARQRERDFPYLKDQGGASSFSDQRFSDDKSSTYAHDHIRQRHDQYETEYRRPVWVGHEDRGFGIDRSRANSYSHHQNNNNQSNYYHPSDARYDTQGHHAPVSPAYRQYPDSHERHHDSYSREFRQHGQRTPSWDTGEEDVAARNQTRQYQIERRGYDAEPTHRNEDVHAAPHSDDNQSSEVCCELVTEASAPRSPEPAAQRLPSDNSPRTNASLKHDIVDDSSRDSIRAPSTAPNSVWKKVDADFPVRHSLEVQPAMRSSSIHPSSNFGGRPLPTTAYQRPSNLIAPASAAAPVRILKRDGPRMLFDPKTGAMVNAEERGSSRSQRPAASSSRTSEAEPSGSSRELASSATEPQPFKSVSNTTAEPQRVGSVKSAAAKYLTCAKPEQIKKRSAGEKVSVVLEKVKNEDVTLPVDSESVKPTTPKAPVQLSSKPLRVKKARDAVVSNSKKGIIKAKPKKKCVLIYRPVVKSASELAAEVAPPTPIPLKKFSELFTTSTSEPAETVKHPAQISAHSTPSALSKPTETKSTFKWTTKADSRKAGKENVKPLAQRLHSKDRKEVRERAKSSTSDESSTHSSHTSAENQSAPTNSSIPASHEESRKLHHSKIKSGVDVDMLKQIPEGGGVVVLTDTQEGIEFIADSENQFETVKSRRALLLEKKQIRESAAAVPKITASLYPRQVTSNNKQGAESGVVFVTPSRNVKRTLVVGVREKGSKTNFVEPSEQTKSGTRAKYPSTRARDQELTSAQAGAPSEKPRQKSTQPVSKSRQTLKPAAKNRVLREPSVTKAAAEVDLEKRDATHAPSNKSVVSAMEHQKGEEKERASRGSKPPRKQRDKVEKQHQQVHPLPTAATQAKLKNAETPMYLNKFDRETKPMSLRSARRKSEVSRVEEKPREAKLLRSSNVTAAPVKKYVPKMPKAVNSDEATKSEATKPESVCVPESTVATKVMKLDAEAKPSNSRRAKQISKLEATDTTAPERSPAPPAIKPSRKVSLSTAPKPRGVKPTPTERPATFKKRLSNSRVDLHAPPTAIAKSYKQIYVVKGSSASTPAPTSSAA